MDHKMILKTLLKAKDTNIKSNVHIALSQIEHLFEDFGTVKDDIRMAQNHTQLITV